MGAGTLTADGTVEVDGQSLKGKAAIICTGSVPRGIPGMDVDGVQGDQLRSRHQQ